MTRSSQKHHERVSISFAKTGRTKQSHKKECDINQIMAKYQKTGVIDHVAKHSENYGFATSEDLHQSLNIIHTANEMFADLPSQARDKFDNDPAQFLDFVQDPDNKDQLYDLGLSDYPTISLPEDKTEPEVVSSSDKPEAVT